MAGEDTWTGAGACSCAGAGKDTGDVLGTGNVEVAYSELPSPILDEGASVSSLASGF